MPEVILQSVSMNDYEKSGSKFAAPGLHLAEFKMADWDTPGRSFKFPFQIIEGPDSGKEGKITAGANAEGVWKLKEILQSLGPVGNTERYPYSRGRRKGHNLY